MPCCCCLPALSFSLSSPHGAGFYSIIPHNVMVLVFAPALVLPLASIGVSIRRYWRSTGGSRITPAQIAAAFGSVAGMKNLAAGHRGMKFRGSGPFLPVAAVCPPAGPVRLPALFRFDIKRGNLALFLQQPRPLSHFVAAETVRHQWRNCTRHGWNLDGHPQVTGLQGSWQ